MKSFYQFMEENTPLSIKDINSYLVALDKIDNSMYTIHSLSPLSEKGTMQAIHDVKDCINRLKDSAIKLKSIS